MSGQWQEQQQETRYRLERRQLVSIEKAGGHLIRCEAGELWLTMEGPQDIVLGPGDSWTIEGEGPVVISALQASRYVISCPDGCSTACEPKLAGAAWTLAGLLRWRAPALAAGSAVRLR